MKSTLLSKVSSACLVMLCLWLTACSQQPTAIPTAVPTLAATAGAATAGAATVTMVPARSATSAPRPTQTSAPAATALPVAATRIPTTAAQSTMWGKWQTSLHANTYDLGKGPNTYCARCHSPQNWDPAAKVDAPPNCVSCKFPTDATVRVAKSNPFVAQADWRNIGCEICHPMQGELASREIAWFNKATGKYEPVANATALCEKCHTDTDVLRHRIDLGTSTHVGLQCTQCHDAHSAQASCTAAQCHTTLSKVSGHDAAHANVSCGACHDASKRQVGPDNNTKTWVTWQTTVVAGMKTTSPAVSHNLQKSVDCARCHFKENPWNLSGTVSKTP